MTRHITKDHIDELWASRGFSPKIAERFNLFSKGDMIGMPFYLNGKEVYVKYRRIAEGSRGMRIEPKLEENGLQQVPFNEEGLILGARNNELIITEGEMDAMTVAHVAPNVISIPGGANANFSWLHSGGKLDQRFAEIETFILCGDSDDQGQQYMDALATQLGRNKCRRVNLEDCKDANQYFVKYGAEALAKQIRSSEFIVPRRLSGLMEIPNKPRMDGLSHGFTNLAGMMLLTFPSLVCVTGTPNSGKSQFTVNWCLNLSRMHNVKVAYLKFEDEKEDFEDDVISYYRRYQKELPQDMVAWVNDHVKFVPTSEAEETENLQWLDEIIYEAANVSGCKVLVVDPWNQMMHNFEGMTETDYTAKALAYLSKQAKKYQIAIIVVNHPTKSAGEKTIEEMSMYDVAGSAHWANRSDLVIVMSRVKEAGSTSVDIKIAKARAQRRRGGTGRGRLRFIRETATYTSREE